jgi:nifR3 family TIM-barrel protein
MVSAKAIVYEQDARPSAPVRTAQLCNIEEDTIPTAIQIFGSEPEFMAEAARLISNSAYRGFEGARPDAIDINMGCPVKKIVQSGDGSALMKNPELIYRITEAVVKASSLPVTVKIRAGWDETCINAVEVAQICEQAGAKAVAVHARTRMQQYSGHADWSIIRDVKKHVSVPVLGNGDVRSGADAVRMIDETGCDGVIVGRAAQGNPWLFGEIRAVLSGESWNPPTAKDRVEMALKHFDLETKLHGDKRGLLEMRKHIAWYVAGLPGASKFRETINTMAGAESVKDALREFGAAAEREA